MPSSVAVVTLIRRLLAALPVPMYITGPHRDRLLAVLDPLCHEALDARHVIKDAQGRSWTLDSAQKSQRTLIYAFENVARAYRYSALGQLMSRARALGAERFVDVGANLGFYGAHALELGYRSILIEPEPIHVDYLRRHAEHLGELIAVALSDERGSAKFYIANEFNPGASSLVLSEPDLESSEIYTSCVNVDVQRLDQALQAHGVQLGDMDLVKVDVEGHEERTMRGGSGIWQAAHAPIVWCEVRGPGSGRAPSSFEPICQMMREHGYQPWRFGYAPWPRRRLERFEARPEQITQVFDLLFLRPEAHRALIASL